MDSDLDTITWSFQDFFELLDGLIILLSVEYDTNVIIGRVSLMDYLFRTKSHKCAILQYQSLSWLTCCRWCGKVQLLCRISCKPFQRTSSWLRQMAHILLQELSGETWILRLTSVLQCCFRFCELCTLICELFHEMLTKRLKDLGHHPSSRDEVENISDIAHWQPNPLVILGVDPVLVLPHLFKSAWISFVCTSVQNWAQLDIFLQSVLFCRPSKARPRRNEPALLPFVLQQVAHCLDESTVDIARRTTETAVKFFGLSWHKVVPGKSKRVVAAL